MYSKKRLDSAYPSQLLVQRGDGNKSTQEPRISRKVGRRIGWMESNVGYKCDSTATWAGELHGRNVIVILDSPGTYVLVFLQGMSTGPQDVSDR